MKICTVLGTRPEIIKLSPLIPLLDQEFDHILIHTGQHYDYNMDAVFFEEFGLKPNYLLGIGSHPREEQIKLMREKIVSKLEIEKPDLVIVQGDTNTTLAGALAASDLKILLVHIESGCRSFSKNMPEEINRIEVDRLSDYLVTPDLEAVENLKKEEILEGKKIWNCGSTTYDAIIRNSKYANYNIINQYNLQNKDFILVTLHRAENTNNLDRFKEIISAINEISTKNKIIFPIHPRTEKIIKENNILINNNVKIIAPTSYGHFLALLSNCKFCMSDSGGIQEEALACNIPCLILRNETEWIRIVNAGKNILVGTEKNKIISAVEKLSDQELQRIRSLPIEYYIGASKDIIKKILDLKNRIQLIHSTADVSSQAKIGENVKIWHQAQIREGAVIGDNCILAKNVYIDKNVRIGANCKIQNNCSVYHGTILEDGVFLGPHCVLTNDKNPRAINPDGTLKDDSSWEEGKIIIKYGASLGARVVVLPNITIGRFALIGAGSVVTKDVPDFGLVYGNPAKLMGYVDKSGKKSKQIK